MSAPTKTHLVWVAAANDVKFNVWRNGVKIATVDSPVYDDLYAGLAPGSYSYDVTGLNGDGVESAPSNVASATVPFPAPGVPTDLVATAA